MRIGIDISQVVHEGTGVARYVRGIVTALVRLGQSHEFVLFGASMRKRGQLIRFADSIRAIHPNVRVITVPIPPTVLEVLWNVLHIIPVEWLVGTLDVFISSDWTQPPLIHAKGVTTIHDLSVLRFPDEHDSRIVSVQSRRLKRVVKECVAILCDSQATKRDCVDYLGIEEKRLSVVYPGFGISV